MKQYALIKVVNMFDPAEVWQHTSDFDKTYTDFLASRGFEAVIVDVRGGAQGEKFFLIKKKEMIDIPEQEEPQKAPQEQLKQMSARPEPKKGQMNWKKGYLKK